MCLVDIANPVTSNTAHDMPEALSAALDNIGNRSIPLDGRYALVAGLTGQVTLTGRNGLAVTCHEDEIELPVISGQDIEF
jgi:hypothetical protein